MPTWAKVLLIILAVLVLLLILGIVLLMVLGSTGAAPFEYTIF